MDAAPFRALRYVPEIAGDPLSTSAPATDDIDRFDYARHRTASPYTVLELVAPRGDGDGEGYATAGAALARWRRTGVLARDPEPAFYVYEQRVPADRTGPGHVQRGVLTAAAIETGRPSQILPHEDVDAGRAAKRLARLLAVPVDIAPVEAIAGELGTGGAHLLARVLRRPPAVSLVDEAGTQHTVTPTSDPAEVAELRELLAGQRVVIADGHHRYAAAAALRRLRPEDPATARTLMLVVDGDREGPRVLPVHRLLARLPEDWPGRLTPDIDVVPAPRELPDLLARLADEREGVVALRLSGEAALLRPRDLPDLRGRMPPGTSPAWRALDTALVDHVLLARLGVPPSAVTARADLEAVNEVDLGSAAALLLVRPVPLAAVRHLAEAGERMPAKTTSFRPKPRTGLVLRAHEAHS